MPSPPTGGPGSCWPPSWGSNQARRYATSSRPSSPMTEQLLATAASAAVPASSNPPAAVASGVAPLPSGLVTFLFTELEDSTRLLQRLGPRYGSLLERHRAIVRTAVAAAGGLEVSTLGDRLLLAFANSSAAITAAGTAQRALGAEAWPAGGSVRVRMGIASGEAVPSGADYAAEAVDRAARICDAAHGGQVLVSEESALLAGIDASTSAHPRRAGPVQPEGLRPAGIAVPTARRWPPIVVSGVTGSARGSPQPARGDERLHRPGGDSEDCHRDPDREPPRDTERARRGGKDAW